MTTSLRSHADAATALIAEHPAANEARFGEQALALFAFQFEHNPAYRALCEPWGHSAEVRHWRDIPAAPAAAFKELDLTVLSAVERTTVFHSSGTTRQRPSRHFHSAESLAVYEASLLAWVEPHLRLRADAVKQLLFLTPPSTLAPHSSLVHMLETIRCTHGKPPPPVVDAHGDHEPRAERRTPVRQASAVRARAELEFGAPIHGQCLAGFHGVLDAEGGWSLDADGLLAALAGATTVARPVALFGTAFNFVHLLDALAARGQRIQLPAGSRVMETGGYKGRSRSMAKLELHQALSQSLGVAPECIVTEYGMSELGSQAYDAVAGTTAPRLLRFPPWARALAVSPENGREVPEGAAGLLRIFDLANVASVMAIQTEDLAVRRGDGFALLGRATASEPRGCSLRTA